MLDRNNTESSRFNVHKAAVVLISMMAFFLPFMVFAIPIKGEGIEPANLIGLILIILNTSLFIYTGRIRRMNISEKMFLLYFGVACLSVVASQLIYGWPEQLIIGIKQLIGIFFMLFIFFSVSWYIRTPATFLQAVTWLWWGSVILALLGLWQFLALNFLKTSFLANYEWAANLNPSIGGWRWPGAMGPVIRVNSFAAEPANYCYFLLGSMGLVTFRLFPPPGVQGTPWKVFLTTTDRKSVV